MLTKKIAIAEKRKLISRKEWEIANRCRLHLQVFSIAYIATGDGQAIDINVRKGLIQKRRIRNMSWPSQGNPASKDWIV